ncbi:hypothetical protein A0H81_09836 [Grifola frondosa]|uniref:Uncharacterized protein n=1 Tax=Grifola frondosa TaxID=5627 RepID=A0A1C7LZL0_GRIFR|nr:hypothetical protein A0H81_09836 [Grifola frondosa]
MLLNGLRSCHRLLPFISFSRPAYGFGKYQRLLVSRQTTRTLTRKYVTDIQYVPRSKHKIVAGQTFHTLDPAKLDKDDYAYLELKSCILYDSGSALFSDPQGVVPPATSGFLYYRTPPPKAPPAAGEIRFRLTPDDDPASFNIGKDLLLPDDTPWHIDLLCIPNFPQLQVLTDVLQRDGLVSPALITECMRLCGGTHLPNNTRLLYALDQPFSLDLSRHNITTYILGQSDLKRHIFPNMFTDTLRHLPQIFHPYKGSVVCRFERSPFPQHANTRTVVVRVLKIVKPVECVMPNYDNAIEEPREGELVVKYGEVLAYNIDETHAFHPLRIFFDEGAE